MRCHAFVGGLPAESDCARLRRGCHVVVGTPGRLRALLDAGFLRTENLRLLVRQDGTLHCTVQGTDPPALQVIDEADTLLAGGFIDDMARLFDALPVQKQARTLSEAWRRVPALTAPLARCSRSRRRIRTCC